MNENIFLEGNTFFLRALAASDLTDKYLQWLNDSEVNRFNSHATFPNTKEQMEQFFSSLTPSHRIVLAIVDKASGSHIGNISLQSINWVNRNAEFAIIIGDKAFWGKGIGEQAIRLVIEYGFTRLNLHRIYCGTIQGNTGMMSIAARLNMKEEGCRREAVFKHGAYHDIIEYGILRSEFAGDV
jgi:ribosomal-protein-alanine N-acetyltransferase